MSEALAPGLSVVVPVFDEVGSLDELYRRVTDACESVGRGHELWFINDGSSDGSSEKLDELAVSDERVHVIHFRRNFGKSPALAAAFSRVSGDIVLTLDADLQDDPSLIPEFVARIDAGADLVSGWKKRRHDPMGKTIPSRLFNFVVRTLTGIPLKDFNCGFKAYRIECIRELDVYGGFHRFMPVLAHDRGFRIEQIVVQHHARKHGRSKFGVGRFVDGLLDLMTVMLVTRFRTRPLHFFGMPGFVFGAAGIGLLVYLSVLWFMGEAIGTRPLLTAGVLLTITSGTFISMGLLGELLVRTTVTQKEVFSIREPRPSRAWDANAESPQSGATTSPVAPVPAPDAETGASTRPVAVGGGESSRG